MPSQNRVSQTHQAPYQMATPSFDAPSSELYLIPIPNNPNDTTVPIQSIEPPTDPTHESASQHISQHSLSEPSISEPSSSQHSSPLLPDPLSSFQFTGSTPLFLSYNVPLRVSLSPSNSLISTFLHQLRNHGFSLTGRGLLFQFVVSERCRLANTPLPQLLQITDRVTLKTSGQVLLIESKHLTALSSLMTAVINSLNRWATKKKTLTVLKSLIECYWEAPNRPKIGFSIVSSASLIDRAGKWEIHENEQLGLLQGTQESETVTGVDKESNGITRNIRKGKRRPKLIMEPRQHQECGQECDNNEIPSPFNSGIRAIDTPHPPRQDTVYSKDEPSLSNDSNSSFFNAFHDCLLSSSTFLNKNQQIVLSKVLKNMNMKQCTLLYSSNTPANDLSQLQSKLASEKILIIAKSANIIVGGYNDFYKHQSIAYTFRFDPVRFFMKENKSISLQILPKEEQNNTNSHLLELKPVGFDLSGCYSSEVLQWDVFEVYGIGVQS